jgi:hypothetical protein
LKAVVDENLPVTLARILHALADESGHTVAHVNDLCRKGTKDRDLFAKIAAEGFTVHISLDHHHRKPAERQAISEHGLVVFVLASSWGSQPLEMKAAWLIRWWPRIVAQAGNIKPPAVFRVPWKVNSQFEVIRNIGRS